MRDIINLIEDEPMQGTIPADEFVKLLPDVVNTNLFKSALQKVENGQETNLNIAERTELANAFISLLKAPDVKKTQIVQKMMPVVGKQPAPQQQPQQPQQQQRL